MSINPEAIEVAQLAISLSIIMFLYYAVYLRQWADRLRCRLRNVRDDLFDFMVENSLDFNSPAYQEVREQLNGMLRLTHSTGPISLLATLIYHSFIMGDAPPPSELSKLPDGKFKQELERVSSVGVRILFGEIYLSGLCGTFVKVLISQIRTWRRLNNWYLSIRKWAEINLLSAAESCPRVSFNAQTR